MMTGRDALDRLLRVAANRSRDSKRRDGVIPRRCPIMSCIWILGGQCPADKALPMELSRDPQEAFEQGKAYANILRSRCIKAVTMAINAGYGELFALEFINLFTESGVSKLE